MVLRSADGATAEVHLHGAHVSSWRPAPDGAERLFFSSRSDLRQGSAMRGGIPVIFPQFAAEGPLPRHGFARTSVWNPTGEETPAAGDAVASFALRDSAATRTIWPASFLATLAVRVGGARLRVELAVENTGGKTFSFTAALHTYLRVHDVREAELVGLRGTQYRESGVPGVLQRDDGETLRIADEIDRVYIAAPRRLVLRDAGQQLEIEAAGFPDVIVWNPGTARAAELKDMEPGGERRMLCVEAGAVQVPVTLDAGARWAASQTLITHRDTNEPE